MKKPIGKSAPAKGRRSPSAAKSVGRGARAAGSDGVGKAGVGKTILTAGIKALSNAGEEAIARQSRVFETLLGFGPRGEASGDGPRDAAPPNPLTAALDPFGFRKFEDVFDQRVARSLANLDAPTAEAFAALTAEVARLRAALEALESRGRKR